MKKYICKKIFNKNYKLQEGKLIYSRNKTSNTPKKKKLGFNLETLQNSYYFVKSINILKDLRTPSLLSLNTTSFFSVGTVLGGTLNNRFLKKRKKKI
jgi:hypothetical protein